jgi:hypothetical protein
MNIPYKKNFLLVSELMVNFNAAHEGFKGCNSAKKHDKRDSNPSMKYFSIFITPMQQDTSI